MLYDNKRWDKQKTDLEYAGIFLSAFMAWLETMPTDLEYDFTDPSVCATAQYKKSLGCEEIAVLFPCNSKETPWLQKIVGIKPYTFGAAFKRARKLAAA